MFSDGKTCPACHTESLHHSHRPFRDWFFRMLHLRSVRCICCYQRFLVARSAYRSGMRRSRLN